MKKTAVLKKVSRQASQLSAGKTLDQMVRVYNDVERTLRDLRSRYSQSGVETSYPIDVAKLIQQLARNKRRLERKIGNTLLLEKQNLGRKLKLIIRKYQ